MPWKTGTAYMMRKEFCHIAYQNKYSGFSELCRRFNISRVTGYKWIKRYQEERKEGLKDSRPVESRAATRIATGDPVAGA